MLIILYTAIFVGIVYGIFRFFVWISSSLLLIDEHFINTVKQIDDSTVQKLISEEDFNKSNEETKKLNRHLRLDFFISLLFGSIWFLFPVLILNLPENKISKIEIEYIGKTLGLFTVISSIWPLLNISKDDNNIKKKIIRGKLISAIIVMLSFLIILYRLNYMSFGNIISVIMTSFWISNGLYAII